MTYRVAVAGLGIGREHLRHWHQLADRFELVAVCDSNPERLASAADRYDLAAFPSFDALLQADVDVIDICTPPYLHFEMATAALQSGRHVVCEKPLVNSLAEADAPDRADRSLRVPADAHQPVSFLYGHPAPETPG